MKKGVLFIFLLVSLNVIAQPPQSFKYQTVVRTGEGELVTEQDIGFRISILRNAIDGQTVYSETHRTWANKFGLVNLQIGNGEPCSGDFATILWGDGTYFIKTEIDLYNSGSYEYMGSSQLLSVPYSLNAGSLTLRSPDGSFYQVQVDNQGSLSANEVVMDNEGNVYKTVKIGAQTWMAENLNIGTMIHAETGGTNNNGIQTNNGVIEKYCYLNLEAYCDTLGALYAWTEALQYDTIENTQGICPDGWHVPSDEDWDELIANFPEDDNAGPLLIGGETGFDVLPNVTWFENQFVIDPSGTYDYPILSAYWSSEVEPYGWFGATYVYFITIINPRVCQNLSSEPWHDGLSIRCIKNNN